MSGDSRPEPVRIRCAADLFSVLSTGSMGAQLAVLRDIAANPKRAFELGRHQEEDLVDLLLRLVTESFGPVKQAQIICLMSFDDPRVTQYLLAEFAGSRDTAAILHLGKRLSMVVESDFFRPYLWDENRARALAAARHCSLGMELSAKERLRVAVVLDSPFEPPALSERTLEVWMEALAGRDRMRVRQLAEQRGQEVLILWMRFSALAVDEQDWLVALSASLRPEFLEERLPELLNGPVPSLKVVEQGLQMGLPLPASLLQSPHHRVRVLAISAGLADGQLETFLKPLVPAAEAAAAARRYSSPERLIELFGDPRWEVRAAASDTLCRVEPKEIPMELLHAKTSSKVVGERVAAVEVLLRLGESQWLQDHLVRSE